MSFVAVYVTNILFFQHNPRVPTLSPILKFCHVHKVTNIEENIRKTKILHRLSEF